MLLPSHLRRSRHGIFYFRIILPTSIARAIGQTEVVRSLGIRCPRHARITGYQIWSQISPFLTKLDQLMTIDPKSINPNDVKKLIVEGLQIGADGSFSATRIETSSDPRVADQEMKTLLAMAQARREAERADGVSPEARARLEDEARKLKAEISEMLAKPDMPTQPLPPRPAKLQEAFDGYMLTKKGIAPSTKKSYTESFELFATMVGGKQRMVHEIDESEFMEFVEALAHVPLHANKRGHQIKTSKEMLASPPAGTGPNGELIELETLAAESANSIRTNILGFMDIAIRSGRRLGANPMERTLRHSDGEEEGGAEAFTETELKTIFDPASFGSAKRPTQFWPALLALYTGARLNELACLGLDDFIEEQGIPCIAIRHIPRKKPLSIQSKRKVPDARRTKNKVSRRLVPLHPDLYEIGIQDYIDDMRSIGATRFFPTLPLDSRGKRERNLSRDGNDYLRKIGVHIHRMKVMHSFRDTVCDMLGVSDMDEVQADQWTGHKNQSVKGKHYRSTVAIKLQAQYGFKALYYPFIDIEKIKYIKGCWNTWTTKHLAA
ncbi:tyrosine-type recombinase/integrase [Massilia sp. CCM 8695]|uniref:Tyrosine-type recombinase/integrase n=1 Tax=Massilia frigida TaxID=2609281 RepID=A0ABX0NJE3_9BURK|nr:site-specific integrase [Massilia frigida]NHZ81565.1 tyrosine-type recombinase/integrase [Massilia frigida]